MTKLQNPCFFSNIHSIPNALVHFFSFKKCKKVYNDHFLFTNVCMYLFVKRDILFVLIHFIFTWLIKFCSTLPIFLHFDLLIPSLFWFLTLFNLISVVLSSPFSYTWGWFLCPGNSNLVEFIKKERGINILATTKTCHMAWLFIKSNINYFFENAGLFTFALFFSIYNMKSQKFLNTWLKWNSVSQWKENFYVTHDWITYLTHESCYIVLSICSMTVIFNSFMTFLFSNFPFLLPKDPRMKKLQIPSASSFVS